MDSKLLTGLALLLFVAAVVTGVAGYRLSQSSSELELAAAQQSAVEPPPVVQLPVVQARRSLPAGKLLAPADLEVRMHHAPVDGSFAAADEVAGRILGQPVVAGKPLTEDHFAIGSALARLLHDDERAVAVGVDEVSAGGGLLAPGDYVDVLVHVRANQSGGRGDVAQVVLQRVRVLSYAGKLEPEPANGGSVADARRARSAVLAVPAADVPRLLLAENLGTLRLAIRPGEAAEPEAAPRGQALNDLLPAAAPAAAPAPAARPAITVHRGGQSSEEQL